MQTNSLLGDFKSCPIIDFPASKTKVYFFWNSFLVSGVSLGTRMINTLGSAFIFEPQSRTVCEINMNYYEKSFLSGMFADRHSGHKCDELFGGIYRVKQELMDKFVKAFSTMSNLKRSLAVKPSQIEHTFSTITGLWHSLL